MYTKELSRWLLGTLRAALVYRFWPPISEVPSYVYGVSHNSLPQF